LSLEICAGEIVGIAGVAGNGQSELAECITGLRPCDSGQVTVAGTPASPMTAGCHPGGCLRIPKTEHTWGLHPI
jgi:simple sugar transport system ATP-binding protein